jgi:hypothetical protein
MLMTLYFLTQQTGAKIKFCQWKSILSDGTRRHATEKCIELQLTKFGMGVFCLFHQHALWLSKHVPKTYLSITVYLNNIFIPISTLLSTTEVCQWVPLKYVSGLKG